MDGAGVLPPSTFQSLKSFSVVHVYYIELVFLRPWHQPEADRKGQEKWLNCSLYGGGTQGMLTDAEAEPVACFKNGPPKTSMPWASGCPQI